MKEYKVLTVKSPEDAEQAMNEYAKTGWNFSDITFWQTAMSYRLIIIFERFKEE